MSLPREVLCEPCPTEGLDAAPSMMPAIASASSADIAEAGRQAAIFADTLAADLLERPFSDAYVGFFPDELVVIEFSPEQAFVQTPGPDAGARLA